MTLAQSASDISFAINQATNFSWTGQHTITRIAGNAPSALPLQLLSLNDGPISNLNNLLNSDYSTVLDIRRSSSLTNDLNTSNDQGGLAAAYIQHKVTGSPAVASASIGLRVALDTTQSGTVSPNDAVSIYSSIDNRGGTNCVGYAYHADVIHAPTQSSAATYGFVGESFAETANGYVAMFHARLRAPQGGATFDTDAGFVCSQGDAGSTRKYVAAFAAGDGTVGGPRCNVAFDAAHATVLDAAIRVPASTAVRMNGTGNEADVLYVHGTTRRLEFRNGGAARFAIPMDGAATTALDIASGNRWFYGGFTPTWQGAIAIKVDSTVFYIPVCTNHP